MTAAQHVALSELDTPARVASLLRQKLGAQRMDLWFGADAKWTTFDHNVIGIEVSSPFVADCITRMFRVELQQSIEEVGGPQVGYRVTVKPKSAEPEVASLPDAPVALSSPVSSLSIPSKPSERTGSSKPGLRLHRSDEVTAIHREPTLESNHLHRLAEMRRENERRWDDFIPGEHNRLVHTAARMVLERPGQISPFFLFGPHGSGKTHLAVGLAHQLRVVHHMRRVLVLTGEQFTIEFTESARGGGFANFRRKYRDVEVLLIDDLQFCLGKSATLAELRNTIDMLLREKRQVILVADRSLNELTGLTSDLHARLAGGMACGMEPLDLETRVNLLARLCAKNDVQLDSSIIRQLASQASGDARVLQGIVHRMVIQQRIHQSPLSQDQAIRATLDLLRASQPIVRLKDIDRVVSDVFGLEENLLKTKTKCQSISQPRMLAMFLARKYTRAALSEIGEFFGKRQHSTVISAQKKVDSWLDEDEIIQCGRGKLSVREIIKTLESTLRVG